MNQGWRPSVLKPFAGAISVLQRILDASLIVLALYVSNSLLDHEWNELLTLAALIGIAVFLIGGEARRLYGSWRLASIDDEFGAVFAIWGITCCALVVAAFLSKVSSNYSRLTITAWFLITPSFLLLSRLVVRLTLRRLRAAGKNMRAVAVVGATTLSEALLQQLEDSATFGVRLSGVFDDRSADRIGKEGGNASRRAGNIRDLVEKSRRGDVDYVFIALPMRAEKRIIELANQLADTTASVYVVPDLFVFDLMRARWTMLGGLPAVSIYESPFDGVSGWLKRAEDLCLGIVFAALAALPMIGIAIGLKLTSRESIFFLQKRYGLNGRVVRVWKFRTMKVSEDGPEVSQATRRDPRITKFGSFLRSTSLDELPQLFNVLNGEMSLVGPRPHAIVVNEQYRRLIHGYMLRHKVKPGITGWAQVNGWHGDDTLEKMRKRVEHDLAYVEDWSLWFDVKILFLTFFAVLSRKNTSQEPAK